MQNTKTQNTEFKSQVGRGYSNVSEFLQWLNTTSQKYKNVKLQNLQNYKKALSTKYKIQKHKIPNAKVKWEEDTAMSHSSYDG